MPGGAREDAHQALAPGVAVGGRERHARRQAAHLRVPIHQAHEGQQLHLVSGAFALHVAVAHPAPVGVGDEIADIGLRGGNL